ncbi:uncharacterized protein LOC123211697 isoform X2 [Mangifera indica]|uniref:uncharacterized protein LOC123211697 isoform X2 n=1 Tax=Mangifera indica TaxID=29780 RepID=UPI001CF9C414|nr:uncharacterized protein LOC123211697 isoform X2 [Mangifera indica]
MRLSYISKRLVIQMPQSFTSFATLNMIPQFSELPERHLQWNSSILLGKKSNILTCIHSLLYNIQLLISIDVCYGGLIPLRLSRESGPVMCEDEANKAMVEEDHDKGNGIIEGLYQYNFQKDYFC